MQSYISLHVKFHIKVQLSVEITSSSCLITAARASHWDFNSQFEHAFVSSPADRSVIFRDYICLLSYYILIRHEPREIIYFRLQFYEQFCNVYIFLFF